MSILDALTDHYPTFQAWNASIGTRPQIAKEARRAPSPIRTSSTHMNHKNASQSGQEGRP